MYVVLHSHPLGRQLHEPVAKTLQTIHRRFLPLPSFICKIRPSIASELKSDGDLKRTHKLNSVFSVFSKNSVKITPAETLQHGRTDVTFFRLLAISTRGPV
jgi:hypothetical protein